MDGRESSLRDLAPCPANLVDVAQNQEEFARNSSLLQTLDVSPLDIDTDSNEIIVPKASAESTIPNASTEATVPQTAMPDSNCIPAF